MSDTPRELYVVGREMTGRTIKEVRSVLENAGEKVSPNDAFVLLEEQFVGADHVVTSDYNSFMLSLMPSMNPNHVDIKDKSLKEVLQNLIDNNSFNKLFLLKTLRVVNDDYRVREGDTLMIHRCK